MGDPVSGEEYGRGLFMKEPTFFICAKPGADPFGDYSRPRSGSSDRGGRLEWATFSFPTAARSPGR